MPTSRRFRSISPRRWPTVLLQSSRTTARTTSRSGTTSRYSSTMVCSRKTTSTTVPRTSPCSRMSMASTSPTTSTRPSSRTIRPIRTAISSISMLMTRRESTATSRQPRTRATACSCSTDSSTLLWFQCSSRSLRRHASHVWMPI